MYVLGGGNYVPEYEAHNDVWIVERRHSLGASRRSRAVATAVVVSGCRVSR